MENKLYKEIYTENSGQSREAFALVNGFFMEREGN